nr:MULTISPECIES: acyl-CoA dehydrogenase family protein [Mycobacterium]
MTPKSLTHHAERIRREMQALLDGVPVGSVRDWPEFLRELGISGLHMPARWGGVPDGTLRRAIAIEELSRRSPAAGATLSAATLGTGLILLGGNRAQQDRWLPELAASREIMTICMTEPDSGSHLLGMQTTAERDGDGWILNGRKCFIGNSHIATAHGVIARTSRGQHHGALSAFVVPTDSAGCRVGDRHSFGGLGEFSIGELVFENCRVDGANLVGSVGMGVALAHAVIARHGKPNIGSLALGLQAAAIDRLLTYTEQRQLYNAPLADLGSIESRVAEAYRQLYLSRIAMYEAAAAADLGHTNEIGFTVAKLSASQSASATALSVAEAMGARGCDSTIGVLDLLADALMTSAPSGTHDVNRKRIAEYARRMHSESADQQRCRVPQLNLVN